MSPGELERKVRQHDGDITAVHELLSGISLQHTRFLHRFDLLDATVEAVEDRLTARIGGLEGRFDALDGRVEGRFDALGERIGGLESVLAEVLRRLPEAS